MRKIIIAFGLLAFLLVLTTNCGVTKRIVVYAEPDTVVVHKKCPKDD